MDVSENAHFPRYLTKELHVAQGSEKLYHKTAHVRDIKNLGVCSKTYGVL